MRNNSSMSDLGHDTGKVVVMDRFRSGKTLSPIRQAEAYWHALKTGSDVPKRSQIDPRGLENVLEYAFIVERIAPGIARFRLAGRHLRDLAGMEVRGMPMTCFFTPDGRDQVSGVLEHMFDTPCVAELNLTGEGKRGPGLEARMILLPLAGELGVVNRALGVLIADGQIGAQPNRFDIARTSLRTLSGTVAEVSGADAETPSAPPVVPAAPVPGFSEAQQPVTGRAPYLRVVK